ncbi:MAG: hypothetical protein ABIH78_02070 [Candidatus Peregrinibacteria bacterium]
MSQIGRIIMAVVSIAVVAGGGIFLWKGGLGGNSTSAGEWEQIVKYYCEQSGGTFADNACNCPSEFGGDMYNRANGQCETTAGGPGGELGVQMGQSIGLQLQLNKCQETLNNYQEELELCCPDGIKAF